MSENVCRGDGRTLLMVAHGTRSPAGVQTIHDVAAAVSARVGPVRTAFVDVLGPNPAEVLAAVKGQAIVVPAFLASGYHVRHDLPSRMAESGHRDTLVTAAAGPDPELAIAMHERLLEVGWRDGAPVVMAAAGSSDPLARADIRTAAALLGHLIGEVHLAYIATGTPSVADAVARLRAEGARRVYIAPYLLAQGRFHTRLMECRADAVAPPLGVHRRVVSLVTARFTTGLSDGGGIPTVGRAHARNGERAALMPSAMTRRAVPEQRAAHRPVLTTRGRTADPMKDGTAHE
ncbi:MAG: cobalamin biosynthesis protein CbiX [Mycobacterium sp.]|nr:cobalamin biosynthesis protein CbiX [Mycobacterium sp.]